VRRRDRREFSLRIGDDHRALVVQQVGEHDAHALALASWGGSQKMGLAAIEERLAVEQAEVKTGRIKQPRRLAVVQRGEIRIAERVGGL
jgi:hypothetical protein